MSATTPPPLHPEDPDDALQRCTAQLRQLQALASIGSWEWNVGTDRVTWSEEMYRIVGWEPGTPIDFSRYAALHHPDDRERVLAAVRRAMETRTEYSIQHRVVRADGAVRHLIGRGQVVVGPDGAAVHLFGTAQDVTEQVEARDARERQTALLQAVSYATEAFLRTPGWEAAAPEVLARLGAAAGVSRVYLFERTRAEGDDLFVRQRFEWTATGAEPQIDNPELQDLPLRAAGYARWAELLEGGRTVVGHVDELPAGERPFLEAQGILSVAVVPFHAAAEWRGFIGFDACGERRAWSAGEIEALRVAARTVGASIEREAAEWSARALEREQAARGAAEDAAGRMRFLAEASAELAGSLDYETTLRRITHLAVPAVADWCAVDLRDEAGVTSRLAVHHADPERIGLVREIMTRYPPDPAAEQGVPEVIRSGRTEFVPHITDTMLEAGARDAEHLRLVRRLGLRSWLAVPLAAGGEVYGALTLAHAESGREYTPDDVTLAEDLARRAATAIQNARLVANISDAHHQMEDQATQLEEQATEMELQTEHLHVQITEAARADAAREQVVRELDAERARLSAIFEHAPVGILLAEVPSGRIVLGNARVEQIFRHPVLRSPDVEAYGEWSAFHADGRRVEGHEYPLARTLASGQPSGPDEYLYHRGDGAHTWVRVTGAPVRDADGTLIGALVVIDEIDAERRAVEERERLLREVAAERALLQQVFDNAPAVMALYTGPDHVVTLINPTWQATVGKPDALGRPFREVFPEFASTGLYETLDRVYRTGQAYRDPEVNVPLDRWNSGEREDTYWDLVWLPLPLRDDGTRDILVHALETTAQVHARRQVQALAEAAHAVHSAATLTDALGVVTEQARRIVGAHQSVVSLSVGQDWSQAINTVSLSEKYARWKDHVGTPDGSGIYAMVCESNRSVRMTQAEIEAHPRWRGFGSDAAAHPPMRGWLAVPLVARDGRNLGLIQLSDRYSGDFTDHDEAVLSQLAQMASVAIENTRLYEEAVQANRAKSDFLATMSHELRTPLNAIGGYTELLEMGIHGPVNEMQRESLARVKRAQEHLLGLINDVLNFAKLEAGHVEMHVRDVAINPLIADVELLIIPQTESRRIVYRRAGGDHELLVRADPEKLQQIVLNLLSNAVKFTDAGGEVSLDWEAAGDDAVRIHVRDTGRGIAPEKLGLIFDPFVQADSDLTRTRQGTGLGLSISRDLARAMHGELTAESTPGAGSTFTLTLPRGEGEGQS